MTAFAVPLLSGCGGEEFGTFDPNAQPDGAPDAHPPGTDANSSGGRAGNGNGGNGNGGNGGAGAVGGGGNGGDDAGGDEHISDGNGMIDDASNEVGFADASDGRLGDAPLGNDADSGRLDASDAQPSDVPWPSDVKDSADTTNDAGNDASFADAEGGPVDVICSEPIVYYKDDDGDGFGKNGETMLACSSPGGNWSVNGGDCRDDLASVKPYKTGWPNPPVYSGVGYSDAAKPQGVSFDYDCSGAEEADPSNLYGVEPACSGPLNCSGVGYTAVNPGRSGSGIDPHCGSLTLKRCQLLLADGITALCSTTMEATTTPYRCR